MKNFILVCLLQIPLLLLAQVQENVVIQNEEISGTTIRSATNSILIKPTTWIKAGTNFTARIVTDGYLPLNVNDDENYVLTRSFQTTTTSTTVSENGDVIETITYYDGLGRPKQSIGIKQSPTKKDIVSHIEYDELGRMVDEFLPYVSSQSNGNIKTGAKNATQTYYKENYAADFPGITNPDLINAFSRKDIEASPLNRVLKQATPGYDWRLGGGHEIEFEYQANTATDAVKQYSVTTRLTETIYEPTLVDDGVYTAGELYKTVTKDENHSGTSKLHTTEEFKNKQGQVVLKRTYAEIGSPSVIEEHDTYYIYDDFGNLTYVLSPKVITRDSVSTTELSELGYQYKYDARNRLVEKKIPGKAWEYIIYDQLDRPVLTQDANLRASNKWLFTKYDALGRVIYTGIYTHGSLANQTTMQTHFNSINNTPGKYYESKLNTPGKLGIYYSYNNFPVNSEVLTVNYYDNYTFNRAGAPVSTTAYNVSSTNRLKGLTTGNRVKVLGSNPEKWITTVTYYDEKARPFYVYSNNDYLETTDIVESKIDFVGKVLETKSTPRKEGKKDIITTDTFEYDHAARLKNQKQQINNQTTETIVDNIYDELGQLTNKEVGNGLQKVDYKYNVRGWLTNINEDANNDNDLFNFTLSYNQVKDNIYGQVKPLYNGNISETYWKTTNDNYQRGYGFAYDALNRIKDAWYLEPEHPNYIATGNVLSKYPNTYELRLITYDKNGNINYLRRSGLGANGDKVIMDRLYYSYQSQSNKLLSVRQGNDATQGGFIDGNTSGNDYQYDANGNITIDKNKKITNIKYNHLNLPIQVTINDKNIDYKYDATGMKLSKTVEGVTTQYTRGYIYENNTLQFFNHPEGYVKPDNTGKFDYVYQYKDHLGNVRLSYTDNNKDGVIDAATEIIEESNYYPFGLKHKGYNNITSSLGNSVAQKFGFGGKEHQDELGLGWIDITARNYDAALGRWMNIDPLAEDMRRHSPYNYAFNNPIRFIDPDGMAPEDIIVTGNRSEKFTQQLNASSNLNITRDERTGKLSATGEAKTDADKAILAAIKDDKVTVEINATSSNIGKSDTFIVGGVFGGSTKNKDGTVTASQTVNPDQAEVIEGFANSKEGVVVTHEVLEAYFGAQDSPGASGNINSSSSQSEKNKFYKAHDKANKIDPRNKISENITTRINETNISKDLKRATYEVYIKNGKNEKLLFKEYNLKR